MTAQAPATVYRARWLIPARGPAIENAALIASGGRIVRVGRWSRLRVHVGPGDAVEAFPDGVILPGFVNAHVHLSLSDMAGKFRPTRDFAGWIGRLVARRIGRREATVRRAVRRGAEESLAAGTVAGADLTPEPECEEVLGGTATRWRVFGELFRFGSAGLKRADERIAALEDLNRRTSVPVGLSPHAPYSVGVEVFVHARREADRRAWPVGAHLHETQDEIAFTERGEGVLCDWMRRVRILPREWRPPGLRPIPALAEAGFFGGAVLVAHGNYLTDEEIEILAQSGSSVAYCPRSHAFFKHENHPWVRLLAAGVNVCLGTDSLASCPSLSILDEMRHVFARERGVDPRTLLAMGTWRGARALGLEHETGDLREGLSANLCVVGPIAEPKEPLAAILAGGGNLIKVLVAKSLSE